jgi:hypothetical protein
MRQVMLLVDAAWPPVHLAVEAAGMRVVATELAPGAHLLRIYLTGQPVYDTITTASEIEGGRTLLMQGLVRPAPTPRQWRAIAAALFPQAREAIWERMRPDGTMYLMRAPI